MLLNKELLLQPSIKNEAVAIYLYFKATNKSLYLINDVRLDLGYPQKDVLNTRSNNDSLMKHIKFLSKLKYLSFSLNNDKLIVTLIPSEFDVVVEGLEQLFINDKLTPTDKRILLSFLFINCEKNKNQLYKLCKIKKRNAIRIVNKFISLGVLHKTIDSPQRLTFELRKLWRENHSIKSFIIRILNLSDLS